MQYLVTIKKKSPMHRLWRANGLLKVNFLNTLFTFNKPTGEYQAQGNLVNIGRLIRHPYAIVNILTIPVGEVKPASPVIPPEDDTDSGKPALFKHFLK